MLLCLLQVRINFCFVLRFCYCNALHRWELMGTLNSGADIEKAIHYLWHCQLNSVQKVELLHGVYKLDFALQNSSEYHLITNLSNSSEISSMKNLNKEIVFLIINFLKTSEGFFEPLFWTSICIYRLYFLFFLFIYVLFIYSSLYRAYCRWSQLSQFFVLFRPVLCRNHSKSTSLTKLNFRPPFLHVTLYHFSPIFLSLPAPYVIHKKVTNYGMKQKKIFCMFGCLSIW